MLKEISIFSIGMVVGKNVDITVGDTVVDINVNMPGMIAGLMVVGSVQGCFAIYELMFRRQWIDIKSEVQRPQTKRINQ